MGRPSRNPQREFADSLAAGTRFALGGWLA